MSNTQSSHDVANGFRVSIVADSVASGVRLTTFACRFPRVILAEVNTHRALCLAGDSLLEFDLPAGNGRGHRRVHRMTIAEFVDKWQGGARRVGANPKREYDLSWVHPDHLYTAGDITARMGLSHNSVVNTAARLGDLRAEKDGNTWVVRGADLINWRKSVPEHTRFDMRSKLMGMRIRQLNEDTGDIQCSTVKDAFVSGDKIVHEVVAGDYRVAGSHDHRVFTPDGWRVIGDLCPGDFIVVARCGKPEDERKDPLRLKRIDGKWRSIWQNEIRKRMLAEDRFCRRCQKCFGEDIHHIVPVHVDLSRAFDATNVTLLCGECHAASHQQQGWQDGKWLYGAAVKVDSITERGVEQTYDLEIAGQYPNFLANGVVVHNSRNAASSRAIPVNHILEQVKNDPFLPGDLPDGLLCGNESGMVATKPLDATQRAAGSATIINHAAHAADAAAYLSQAGWHKQDANRYLEPFQWVRWVGTATNWDNFFALRTDHRAYPPFRFLARCMWVAYTRSRPNDLRLHLPFITPDDWMAARAVADTVEPPDWFPGWWYGRTITPKAAFNLMTWSAARCARVSVKNFRTDDTDRAKDYETFLKLTTDAPRHASPLEHPAFVSSVSGSMYGGNFAKPWCQFRKLLPDECVERFDPPTDEVERWNVPDAVFGGTPGVDW